MSNERVIFSLGDGFDSITGAHKGRGIISFKGEVPDSDNLPTKDDPGSDKKSSPHPRAWTQVFSGDTQYDITIVTDYQDLYQALDLKTSLTAQIDIGLSSEASLFKKAKLSKQSLSLLIKGSKIGNVHIIPPDASIESEHIETLEKRRGTFVESHGDQYISQVMYGKKIYALINFENSSREEIFNLKHSLEGKLITNQVSGNSGSIYESTQNLKHSISDIRLECAGVDLELPSSCSNIDDLFKFIDQFNKAKIMDSPIGFAAEPYVTILPTRAAAELSKQIKMIHPLLLEYDKACNKIRLIIPTIEKLVAGIHHFQLNDEICQAKLKRIQNLLKQANEYKKTLEDLILEINLNKIDLTIIPESLTKKITLDIPSDMTLKQYTGDDDLISADFHKKQFYIYDQLNSILRLYTANIYDLEIDVDNLSQQLVAEIARITPGEIFTLNLPLAGTHVRWEILNSTLKTFDILTKDSSRCFSRFKPLHQGIGNGMQIKMSVSPEHLLKIDTHKPEEFEIVASVVGLQALDPNLTRYSTSWVTKSLSQFKEREPINTTNEIEFNGKFKNNSIKFFEEKKSQEKSDNELIKSVTMTNSK